jgi:hypothetical protein
MSRANQKVELSLNKQSVYVQRSILQKQCPEFQIPAKLVYAVRSRVSFNILRKFNAILNGMDMPIDDSEVPGLLLLCNEFRFVGLRSKLADRQMTKVKIIFGQKEYFISQNALINKCPRFKTIESGSYTITSCASPKIVTEFVRAIDDGNIPITVDNCSGLSRLADEFGFSALSQQISNFIDSPEFKAKNATRVHLSAKRLKQTHGGSGTFAFKVGANTYSCPLFVAEFLSEKVSDLRAVDGCLCELMVEVRDPDEKFSDFLALGFGEEIAIHDGNAEFLRAICVELGNEEIATEVFRKFCDKTGNNELIEKLSEIGGNVQKELDSLAAGFCDIDPNVMSELPIDLLYELFSQSSLKLKSEDWLCEFILNAADDDHDYFKLLEFIGFEFLSPNAMTAFIERIDVSMPYLTFPVWKRLLLRFKVPIGEEWPDEIEFKFQQKPLDGVIAFLTDLCKGNVHDRGIVKLTSNSNLPGSSVRSIVDFGSTDVVNLPGMRPSVTFGFKSRELKLSEVAFRGDPTSRDIQPFALLFEGSRDGTHWTTIYQGQPKFRFQPLKVCIYQVPCPRAFKFIRITKPDTGWKVCSIELFGTLSKPKAKIRPKPVPVTCPFRPDDTYNGIIAHLTNKCGSNVHTHGLVQITASSVCPQSRNSTYQPQQLADLLEYSIFDSQDLPDQWVCLDFGTMSMAATHYTIRTTGAGERGPHLKSWVIEGSVDGQQWTELDRKENNGQLKARNAYVSFAMSTPTEVRMIRLRQTGRNHVGNNYLTLSAFEIFGTISGVPQNIGTPRRQEIGLHQLRPVRYPVRTYHQDGIYEPDEPDDSGWDDGDDGGDWVDDFYFNESGPDSG